MRREAALRAGDHVLKPRGHATLTAGPTEARLGDGCLADTLRLKKRVRKETICAYSQRDAHLEACFALGLRTLLAFAL